MMRTQKEIPGGGLQRFKKDQKKELKMGCLNKHTWTYIIWCFAAEPKTEGGGKDNVPYPEKKEDEK